MSELQNKITTAAKLLRSWCVEFDWNSRFLPGMCPDTTPRLCFSGGKDSIFTRFLCDTAGISYAPEYSVTTLDPPPLVKFIFKHHPDVKLCKPETTFFKARAITDFRIRQNRWCCKLFKENTSASMLKIIAVRAAESNRRARQWSLITKIRRQEQWAICPALHFSDAEVWEVIRTEGMPYCELYDQGFNRLGCIGCPMASPAELRRQLEMFPGYEKQYRRAFAGLWEKRAGTISPKTGREWFGSRKFRNSDDLFAWWLLDISSPEDLEKSGFLID